MGKKKHKKAKHRDKAAAYAGGSWGEHPHYSGFGAQGHHAGGFGAGLVDEDFLRGLPGRLKSGQYEQFLMGAVIGAAAAYVLSDEELRAKLVKTGIKLYSNVVGGLEEMKEQMADLKAEAEAERRGDA
ncbi:YtxH domain-containing protein [Aromatoleum buckelii]|uniref:YtxH domain-containing protein n=1 Tax=Aromatoleum buckelii TaxID=200254 RepID=UPI001B7CDECD|nr:YtxH domain-containing protein [Aromatoleum buckelii]MCK0512361.1 YtxH domain-containing protein [Aromatoleum buckelii]